MMVMGLAAAVAGTVAMLGSLVWIAYVMGCKEGRAAALDDALGGRGWLAQGPSPHSKLDEVARALALAQSTLGRGRSSIVPPGVPSSETRLLAQAAIGAMRIPSREQIEAVVPYLHETGELVMLSCYDIMIEAAVDPTPGPAARRVTPEGIEAVRRTLLPFAKDHYNGV